MSALVHGYSLRSTGYFDFGRFLEELPSSPYVIEFQSEDGDTLRRQTRKNQPDSTCSVQRQMYFSKIPNSNRWAGCILLEGVAGHRMAGFREGTRVRIKKELLTEAGVELSWFLYDEHNKGVLFESLVNQGLGPRGFFLRIRGAYRRERTDAKKKEMRGTSAERSKINELFKASNLDLTPVMRGEDMVALLGRLKSGNLVLTVGPGDVYQNVVGGAQRLAVQKISLRVSDDTEPDSKKRGKWLVNHLQRLGARKAKIADGEDYDGNKMDVPDLLNLERAVALHEMDSDTWIEEMDEVEIEPSEFPSTAGTLLTPIERLNKLMDTHDGLFKKILHGGQ